MNKPVAAPVSARAAALHASALVWDNHGCMPQDNSTPWLKELEQYRRGGVDVAAINIGDSDISLDRVIRQAANIRAYVKANPEHYALVGTVAEIEKARANGQLAVFFDLEGVVSIGEDVSLVEFYYDIGVRWTLMVYNRRNLAGSGCHDDEDLGLTDLGRRLVAEMDRVGMIKCCSHTGYRTAMDILTGTDAPTIFSHSNPRALKAHPRNIPDELIDACAATGGVVCLNGIGPFLGDNEATPSRIVDHIDYVAGRIGADHVGLGLDYIFDQEGMNAHLTQNAGLWPAGYGYEPGLRMLGPLDLPQITQEMLRRGRPEAEVRQILGENLMRVARAVWK